MPQKLTPAQKSDFKNYVEFARTVHEQLEVVVGLSSGFDFSRDSLVRLEADYWRHPEWLVRSPLNDVEHLLHLMGQYRECLAGTPCPQPGLSGCEYAHGPGMSI